MKIALLKYPKRAAMQAQWKPLSSLLLQAQLKKIPPKQVKVPTVLTLYVLKAPLAQGSTGYNAYYLAFCQFQACHSRCEASQLPRVRVLAPCTR